MRFRSGARLDPSQVTDVRGRRVGGPVLAGGGGIGVVGLTSMSASSTSCTRGSAPRADRSPRATSSPTSTATMCRTCSVTIDRDQRRGPAASRSAPSSRPTATRACGPPRCRYRLSGAADPERRGPGPRCCGVGRGRPHPAGDHGQYRSRGVDARLGAAAAAVVLEAATRAADPDCLRHLRRHRSELVPGRLPGRSAGRPSTRRAPPRPTGASPRRTWSCTSPAAAAA